MNGDRVNLYHAEAQARLAAEAAASLADQAAIEAADDVGFDTFVDRYLSQQA